MNLYQLLRRPVITEKATQLHSQGKYVFEVDGGANKPRIKMAVEKAFNVKVGKVNVMTVPAKRRRAGRRWAITSSWKKAVVTLKPGYKIEFFEGV